ncbi:MAG: transposase, partial [Oscillospiraceae bacterium]|nr:transposase [Oscillospiraceae bacterium]
FLDESGINTDMTPIYGWGKRANHVTDSAPLNIPKTTTVLSSIRLNGEKVFTTYEGETTGKRFVTYLWEMLIPTLKKGAIVVMDNLRSHHVKEVEELLRQNEITLLYLPPL